MRDATKDSQKYLRLNNTRNGESPDHYLHERVLDDLNLDFLEDIPDLGENGEPTP